jgi:hypothetical protein
LLLTSEYKDGHVQCDQMSSQVVDKAFSATEVSYQAGPLKIDRRDLLWNAYQKLGEKGRTKLTEYVTR